MPATSVRFHLDGELLPAQVEAAARRRLRILESTLPAVCEWEVAAQSQGAREASGHGAQAHVIATIVGGDRFRASADGADALAALRRAFDDVEMQLHAEKESARQRAFHWLEKVRSRTAQSWFTAE